MPEIPLQNCDILWEGLGVERIREVEAKWLLNRKRIDAVDRGELQTVDEPSPLEIFARLSGNEALSQLR